MRITESQLRRLIQKEMTQAVASRATLPPAPDPNEEGWVREDRIDQLRNAPVGSVILDSNGKSWKKTDSGFRGGHWKMPHNDLWIDTVDMKRIGFVFIKGGI